MTQKNEITYDVDTGIVKVIAKFSEIEFTKEIELIDIFYIEEFVTEDKIIMKINDDIVQWLNSLVNLTYSIDLDTLTLQYKYTLNTDTNNSKEEILTDEKYKKMLQTNTEEEIHTMIYRELQTWYLDIIETSIEIIN